MATNSVTDEGKGVYPSRDFEGVYAAFVASREDFNCAPEREAKRLGRTYTERLAELEAAAPDTPLSFVKKFYALWDDNDEPPQNVIDQMVEEAATLIGRGSSMNAARHGNQSAMHSIDIYNDLAVEIEAAQVLCRKVVAALDEEELIDVVVLANLLGRQLDLAEAAKRQVWEKMSEMSRQLEKESVA